MFNFHRPEYLRALLKAPDTIRNNMKRFPSFDTTGFRSCQITAIENLERSFACNRPRALIQMATGAGKTFTAITAVYRLLKYAKINRVLFLVDTKGLGEQAEREFLAYRPNDDNRSFSEIYGVRRLKSGVQGWFIRLRQSREETRKAVDRLNDSKLIHRAQAVLARTQGVPESRAYEILRRMSMDKRVPMAELARSILEQEEKPC